MNISAPLAALLLASPTAFAPADTLQFAPEQGSTSKRTFTEATAWKLVSLQQKINGSPAPMPTPDSQGAVERKLVVVDTFTALAGGVPLELEREFDTVAEKSSIDFSMEGVDDNVELELASPLEGVSVVFERKDKGAEAVAKFASERAPSSSSLAGLREDLDLRALIAAAEVAEGDHWKLDAATLADVLAPGGALQCSPAPKSIPPAQFLEPADIVSTTLLSIADSASELAGEVTCTWRETRKEGETKLAVIEIDWESTARGELGPELVRRLQAAEQETERNELEFNTSWSSKGKGELVWDLSAKRAHSLSLKLDSNVDVEVTWNQEGAALALAFTLKAESEIAAEFSAQ